LRLPQVGGRPTRPLGAKKGNRRVVRKYGLQTSLLLLSFRRASVGGCVIRSKQADTQQHASCICKARVFSEEVSGQTQALGYPDIAHVYVVSADPNSIRRAWPQWSESRQSARDAMCHLRTPAPQHRPTTGDANATAPGQTRSLCAGRRIEADDLSGDLCIALFPPVRPAVLDRYGAPLDLVEFAQSLH
jgi:hypothetical protein